MAVRLMVSPRLREPKLARDRTVRAPKCFRPLRVVNAHQNAPRPRGMWLSEPVRSRCHGRRILDGLCRGDRREEIHGGLTWHVHRKLEDLGDALTLTLSDSSRLLLVDLLPHERATNATFRLEQSGNIA